MTKTSRGARACACASVVVLLAMTSACAAANDSSRRVAVIGDSITFIATGEIEATRGNRRFEVRSVLGATSLQMFDDARKLADEQPAQVIINLGTNDAMLGARPDDTVQVIRRMIALFPDARCVHVTTLNESMENPKVPDLRSRVVEINDGLHQIASGDGQVDLIDWNGFVLRYLQSDQPDGQLLADTVHPTDFGQRQLAHLYRDAVEQCRSKAVATT